jgi:hypothetical protein
MVTVAMSESTYERLQSKAAARKLSLEAYLSELAEQSDAVDKPRKQLEAIESFVEGMTAWTSAHLPPGHETDDRRETLYEGRGG